MRTARLSMLLAALLATLVAGCGNSTQPSERCAPGADTDGDGLTNDVECTLGSDPMSADSDGDGVPDGAEASYPHACIATDPTAQRRPPTSCTTDDDCLAAERCLGLDPTRADSDGDGLADGAEDVGLDGTIDGAAGETDPRLVDTDGDGVSDGASRDGGTGPDGGVGPDGSTGTPCTSIADCRFAEACIDGFCVSTRDGGTGGDGGMAPGFDMTPSAPVTGDGRGRLIGHVTDVDGVAIAGATVSLTPAGGTATTDAAGNYELELDAGAYVVHFGSAGFLSTHRRTSVASWERVYLNVSLLRASASDSVDGAAGGVAETEGYAFGVPPGSLVDADGVPVTGTVEVAVTPIDPSTSDIDGSPGDFVGVDPATGSMPDPLVSYGMVDVSATGPDGRPLTMDPDAPPTEVVIPATTPPGEMPVMPGDEVPLWVFDPPTGTWIPAGVAVAEERDGVVVFVGTASQLGTFNCDVPVVPVCVQGRVTDCGGYGIPGAQLRMRTTTTSVATGRTDADGAYTICGVGRGQVIVNAKVNLGAIVLSRDTPPLPVGRTATMISAPDLVFDDMRYVTGTVELSRSESRTWTGTRDAILSTQSGTSYFWDLGRAPIPRFVSCEGPDDVITATPLMSSGTGAGTFTRLDVGNPIVVGAGAAALPLYRYYAPVMGGGTMFDGYRTPVGTTLAAGPSLLDVSIPGAAGVMPAFARPGALSLPADLAVTSPAPESARAFDRAAPIPLRWTPPTAGGTMIRVLVMPETGGTQLLVGTLVDDGSFDLDVSAIGPVSRATITLARVAQRFERLATGPQLMLEGASRVALSVELR